MSPAAGARAAVPVGPDRALAAPVLRPAPPPAGSDAALALALIAAAPPGLGGLWLRARAGPAREAFLDQLARRCGPLRRLPACPGAELFAGGPDALASMAAGRRVERHSPLAAGGLWLLPMAERLDPAAAAAIARALDGQPSLRIVALDEGVEPAERCPDLLAERLGLWLELETPATEPAQPGADRLDQEQALAALTRAAARLGIGAPRPVLMTLAVARTLAGEAAVPLPLEHVAAAVRLVLAPRARALPEPAEPPPPPPPPPASAQDPGPGEAGPASLDALSELLLDAARAVLPAGLTTGPAARLRRPQPGAGARGTGARCPSLRTGRPRGTQPGPPRGGARLALAETLRAAAPWQRLRGAGQGDGARPRLRPDDLRVRRFEARARTTTILLIDASGSAALARLAEAKGAALLLLGEAYVERAAVAVIAVRGEAARLLLPPTRSLARARRELAGLPGGGGTPLASGLALALRLALAERARGRTPLVVALTDGRGNVALDPAAGRERAQADLAAMAQALAANGIRAIVIDIARSARGDAAALAAAMRAGYAALPRLEAGAVRDLARAALAAR